MRYKSVLVVGSAQKSGGGVASVIRLHEQMPVWREWGCYWLETQIQAGVLTKLWYALRAAVKGFFLMPKFKMVHFHTVPDQSMTVQLPVLLWAMLWRRKVIFHIHCGNQLKMPMCIDNRIAHWCMGHADALILLADNYRPLVERYWPEAKGKKFVLRNPQEKLRITNYELRKKTVLFAGIFNENKAPDVVVRAWDLLCRYDNDWKLVLLGSGPMEGKLRAMIREYGLEERVVMPGYVRGEEKEQYFAEASIYVMSSHYEGFPMVVLEAWQNEVAVVSTPVLDKRSLHDNNEHSSYDNLQVSTEGSNDNRNDNVGAFLPFDYDDVEGLARQLRRLMADDALRSQLGRNGRRLVEEQFTMDRVNEDLRRIYQNILFDN